MTICVQTTNLRDKKTLKYPLHHPPTHLATIAGRQKKQNKSPLTQPTLFPNVRLIITTIKKNPSSGYKKTRDPSGFHSIPYLSVAQTGANWPTPCQYIYGVNRVTWRYLYWGKRGRKPGFLFKTFPSTAGHKSARRNRAERDWTALLPVWILLFLFPCLGFSVYWVEVGWDPRRLPEEFICGMPK